MEQMNRRKGEYVRKYSAQTHQIAGRRQEDKNDDTKDY